LNTYLPFHHILCQGSSDMSQPEKEACAICLDVLNFKNKKIHTTSCGHRFHETCFEKLKNTVKTVTLPTGGTVEHKILSCPCCRTEIDPTLKQKIKDIRVALKEVSDDVRDYNHIYNLQIQCQNEVIRNLENALRQAKQTKRIVNQEMTNATRYLKDYQNRLKTDLANYLEEMKRSRSKTVEPSHDPEENNVVPINNDNIPRQAPRVRLRIVESLSNV